MQKTLVAIMHGVGGLATIAAIVAFPAGVFLLWQLDRTLHADRYRPATFTVAWVAYQPGVRSSSPQWWAVGTVDGHRERFGLEGVVTRAQGWDDLEAQVQPGRKIPVLYDPSFPKTADTRALRVIPYEDDFPQRQRARLARWAAIVYGPSVLLLATSLTLGVLVGRVSPTAKITILFLVLGLGALAAIRGTQVMSRPSTSGDADLAPWGAVWRLVPDVPGPVIALVFVLLASQAIRGQRKRKDELRRRAREMGFEFLGDVAAVGADAEIEALGPFALFRRGVIGGRRFVSSRMRGSRDGHDLVVFDYGFTPVGRRLSTWRTVARVTLARRLPPFSLLPRSVAEGVAEALGLVQTIAFDEHPHLRDEYVVQGADPAAVRAAFGPDVIAWLEEDSSWTVESDGAHLLVHRDEEVAPADLGEFLADVMRLVAAFEASAP